ncbi:CPBP family intramembrane glutamic endopeptidase [Cytobacillus sp. FJAT-54145]|uniref:CPBP family intramembrane glutamic endopeptidase n=1 Tax=Cytobacillus spartinae TaxID=3299023 RepID=A0ABW6KD39_9BACI
MNRLNKLQSFFRNHPFVFAFFVLVASRIAGGITIQAVQMVRPGLTVENDLGWLLMTVYASVAVSLVYWTDIAKEIGLKKPHSYKEWLFALPLLILPLYILSEKGISSWGLSQNLVLLIAAIGVSVNEEVIFRGILLNAFLKRWGKWVAVFVPSILFAFTHTTNVIAGGDTMYAIYQTLWTFAGGVILAGIRIRTGSLYPVILFHFVLDFVEYFATGNYGVHSEPYATTLLIPIVIMSIVLMVYTIILLFKSNDLKQKDSNYSL